MSYEQYMNKWLDIYAGISPPNVPYAAQEPISSITVRFNVISASAAIAFMSCRTMMRRTMTTIPSA